MSKKIITFLFCLFIGFIMTNTSANAQVNFFLGTMDDLKRNANVQEKYYVLFFEADWCQPCKRMQQDVFTDTQVGNLMDRKFILKKINGEHEAYVGMVQELFVQSYPTTLIFDENGNEVMRLVGYFDKNDFMNELKTFVPGSRKTTYSEFR